MLEDWVRERPEQWLWVHKRWPDWRRSEARDQRPEVRDQKADGWRL